MNYQPPPAGGGGGAVSSVDGLTGAVVLTSLDGVTINPSTPEPGAFSTLTVTGDVASYTATGSTQGTAVALTAAICVITGQSGGNSGVLSAAKAKQEARNRSGASMLIFPPSGDQIEGTTGINLPVTLPNASNCLFVRAPSGTWYC